MSAYGKAKLKAVRASIGGKDWSAALAGAVELLSHEPDNYHALVFKGLAAANLSQLPDALDAYKAAIALQPAQALAHQGLATLYEKEARWEDYVAETEVLLELFVEAGEAVKAAETVSKLLATVRAEVPDKLANALSHVVPSSATFELLRSVNESDLPRELAYQIAHPLAAKQELLAILTKTETRELEAEVKRRRQRLGGLTLSASDTQRAILRERAAASKIPDLLRSIMDDPDAGEDVRRATENELFDWLSRYLDALAANTQAIDFSAAGGSAAPKTGAKEEEGTGSLAELGRVRAELQELARGVVLLKVPLREAWDVVLDWDDDVPSVGSKAAKWARLNDFEDVFPEDGLSKVWAAWKAEFQPPPPEEAEEGQPKSEPKPAEVKMAELADLLEDALATCATSLTAHLVSTQLLLSVSDYSALLPLCSSGLSLIRSVSQLGSQLPNSTRALESAQALSWVYAEPPDRAMGKAGRSLKKLLDEGRETELVAALARVHMDGEEWAPALAAWDEVSAAKETSAEERARIDSERGWCFSRLGELASARTALEGSRSVFEARRTAREAERVAKEKERSRKGLEKAVGVEEGERAAEATERARAAWRLGEVFWALASAGGEQAGEMQQAAHDAYLSALQADSSLAPAYTSMGILFRTIEPPDLPRASKCFQRAFELDPAEEVAARYLAEEFALLGEWTLVEVVARRVVAGLGDGARGANKVVQRSWAWKAIGGAELHSQQYDRAIVAFQNALKGAPKDSHTWVRLGVAYRGAGKHVASLKVFDRALSLNPALWYAKFCIADVQRELGLLEPSLGRLRRLIEEHPEEFGIRIVRAETALLLAQSELAKGLFFRAGESFIEALEAAREIIEKGDATRIAWKIAADALDGLSHLHDPNHAAKAIDSAISLVEATEEAGVGKKLEGVPSIPPSMALQLLQKDDVTPVALLPAAACLLKMRLLLEVQNVATVGSAWSDLAIALFKVHKAADALHLAKEDVESTLHNAVRCIKFALHKEPINSSFWGTLGVIAFSLSPRLSQHAFIKSLEHNPRSAVGWTNLGYFYVAHDDHELANEAFLKAQVLDPDHKAAWIGQAVLADAAGHQYECAMLYEHAASILGASLTPAGDAGYATKAFQRYRARVQTTSAAEVGAASDFLSGPLTALTRYLSWNPDDSNAQHLNALLFEQLGDLESASIALEAAAAKLEAQYEVDESPLVERKYIIAMTNLGRVRLARGQYEEALEAFESALSLLSESLVDLSSSPDKNAVITLSTGCRMGSALAHFFLKDPERAVEALELGLEDLDNNEVTGSKREGICVLLAKVHWSMQGEELAKGCLVDGLDLRHASEQLLMPAFSLSSITHDRTFANNVRYRLSSTAATRSSVLVCQGFVRDALFRRDLKSIRRSFESAIHVNWANMTGLQLKREMAGRLLRMPMGVVGREMGYGYDTIERLLEGSEPSFAQKREMKGEPAQARAQRELYWAFLSWKEGEDPVAATGTERELRRREKPRKEAMQARTERAIWLQPWEPMSWKAWELTRRCE